jgi:drug/metabolite transporter (DMT)-like permease
MFYQMFVIVAVLLPVLFIYTPIPPTRELPALFSLGLLTTAIGHTLFVNSFRQFSISTASLMSSVQPIFGILLGVLFLREIPDWTSVIGGAVIVATVVIEAIRSRK